MNLSEISEEIALQRSGNLGNGGGTDGRIARSGAFKLQWSKNRPEKVEKIRNKSSTPEHRPPRHCPLAAQPKATKHTPQAALREHRALSLEALTLDCLRRKVALCPRRRRRSPRVQTRLPKTPRNATTSKRTQCTVPVQKNHQPITADSPVAIAAEHELINRTDFLPWSPTHGQPQLRHLPEHILVKVFFPPRL